MRVLFTPWRYEYLTAPKGEPGCIFCTAVESQDTGETLTVFKGRYVLVMLNRYPYTNGHVMVAPLEHAARLEETDDSILTALIRVTAFTQRALSEVYHPDGFNIGMNIGSAAGAGVADHYHMHVVPRWRGDSNFMSVTASTRLVPENLEDTFGKLAPRFDGYSDEFPGEDQ